MSEESEISIFRCLDFIRDNAEKLGQAKADRVYCEEYRKSLKSILMKKAEVDGHKSAVMQEREAYAADEYMEHLTALSAAVQKEETLRWKMIAAQAKIECWRSLESSRRIEAKNL